MTSGSLVRSKFVWLASLAVLIILSVVLFAPGQKASAAYCGSGTSPDGYLYFGGTNDGCNVYGPGGGEVSNGTFGCSVGDSDSVCKQGAQAYTDKATFIEAAQGSPAYAFYVNLMLGEPAEPKGSRQRPPTSDQVKEWKEEINSPDVGIRVGYYSNSWNSMSIDGDYAFFQESKPVNKISLIFYNTQTGTIYTVIKADCGNPLNSLPLPSAQTNSPPTGHITVACAANGRAELKYYYSDPDGPTATVPSGATAAYSRVTSVSPNPGFANMYYGNTLGGNSAWNRQDYGASPTEQQDVLGNGTQEAWLYVEDDGPAAPDSSHGYDYYKTSDSPQAINCKQKPPVKKQPTTTSDCPGDPTYDSSSRTTLKTPFKNPDGTTNPDGGTGTSPKGTLSNATTSDQNATLKQDTSMYNDNFVPQDTDTQGIKFPPKIVSYNSNKTTVTIDPSKFVTNYPYDNNSADVTYDTEYKLTVWTASHFDHYKCEGISNGGTTTRSGGTCTYTPKLTSTTSTSCPVLGSPWGASSGTTSGGQCHYTYSSPDGKTCPSGGSGPSRSGNCYINETPTTTTTYYCDGVEISGSSCSPTTYSATKYYSYVSGGQSSETASGTSSSYTMNACFNRGFEITQAEDPTISFNNDEDPTNLNSHDTVDVQYVQPDDGPTPIGYRSPLKVNLNYTATYYLNQSSPYPFSCSATGTVMESSASSTPGSGSGTASSSCGAAAPPLMAGDVGCVVYKFISAGDYMNIGGTQQSSIDPSISLANGNGDSVSSIKVCSPPISNLPYAQFFGNDVAAGGAFASGYDNCSGEDANSVGFINANIERLVTGQPLMRGSGSQLAAIATESVNSFITANLRSSSPTSQYGLTFSNTNQGYIGTPFCLPDYFGDQPSTTSAQKTATGRQIIVQKSNTDMTINGLYVPDNVSQTIYVDGDVTITGNILYQTDGWQKTGINTTNAPNLYIIAAGDINIDPSVTQLAGTFVAQDGTIDTCDSHDYASCNKQLTVNGSFVANKVNLYRTFASLRDSDGGEWPDPSGPTPNAGSGGNCDTGDNGQSAVVNNPNRSNNYDCAAEIFIFSPADYLSQPALPPNGGSGASQYDDISSLSPVL